MSVGYWGKSKTTKSKRIPVFKFLKQVYSKLLSAFNILVMFKDMERYFIVTIKCNPKMTNEVKHVFIFVCLMDILFVECFFKFCLVDRYFYSFFYFLCWVCKIFLKYTLDIGYLWVLCIANIGCLLWLTYFTYYKQGRIQCREANICNLS